MTTVTIHWPKVSNNIDRMGFFPGNIWVVI